MKDKKFFVEKGDQGFNPDRNKFIIEETIRQHDKNMKKKDKEYVDKLRERTDAVVCYLKRLVNGSSLSVEKYFGKRELARLRGEQIVNRIKGNIRG